MASGKQIAEQNFIAFSKWMASKTDGDYRQMVSRGVLSRKEIAKECCITRSALDQNPRLKAALNHLEQGLRERGILPPLVEKSSEHSNEPPMREAGKQKAIFAEERIRRLEQENACLRAENGDLKKRLERYAIIHETLTSTGRVPR